MSKFNKELSFGTAVLIRSRYFKFYGPSIVQLEDSSLSIHVGNNLNILEGFPFSTIRLRHHDSTLSTIENSSSMSFNASLGWLVIDGSSLCAFYSSHLQQQQLPTETVITLCSQIRYLRSLKSLELTISLLPRPHSGDYSISISVFSDDGRVEFHGQILYLAGILSRTLSEGSKFYTRPSSIHKLKHPVT